MNSEDKKLAKLLKSYQLDQPSHDFNKTVMELIKHEDGIDLSVMINPMDKKSLLDEPHPTFYNDTMDLILSKASKKKNTSVLRMRVISFVLVLTSVLSTVLIFTKNDLSPSTVDSLSLFNLSEIPPILAVTSISIFSLILLDTFLSRHKLFS